MLRHNAVYILVAAALLILFLNLKGGHPPPPPPPPPFDAHHGSYPPEHPAHLDTNHRFEYSDSPHYQDYSNDVEPPIPVTHSSESTEHRTGSIAHSSDEHPIDRLIARAEQQFADLLNARSTTLEDAAAKYRARRGRHPPPGFDQWFEYASRNDAIISEAMFDTIYHDLEPFWGVLPAEVRAKSRALGMHVQITKGVAEAKTDWFWHVIWGKMINEVAYMLPDMMIALNAMDEPRLIVPWEDTATYVAQAHSTKHIVGLDQVKESVTGWDEKYEESFTGDIWGRFDAKAVPYSYARAACPPDSPMRASSVTPFSGKVMAGIMSPESDVLGHQQVLSYVENTTTASDVCQDAKVAAYHGAIISPLSSEISRQLLPMFGGSKFAVNNEILLPAAMYWNGEERFEQPDSTPWSQKSNIIIWRGTATGGRHNAMNWPQFHRLRFVAQANGTKYSHSDPEHDRIFTPAFRHEAISTLPKVLQERLGTWLDVNNDCQFTDLFCDIPTADATCWYLDNEFLVTYQQPLASQYTHKFLPDIDGNSFSGRYRSFLQSKSVPIKATLFREWHDSRLIAWKHFVPMNNKFTDYYSILSYFIGCSRDVCGEDAFEGHDAQAEAIGEAGSEWAQKVLRKVDMQIYIARLLLEYGRLTDDQRDVVGFVRDLKPKDDKKAAQFHNQTERIH